MTLEVNQHASSDASHENLQIEFEIELSCLWQLQFAHQHERVAPVEAELRNIFEVHACAGIIHKGK